jgi:hypothetical protein
MSTFFKVKLTRSANWFFAPFLNKCSNKLIAAHAVAGGSFLSVQKGTKETQGLCPLTLRRKNRFGVKSDDLFILFRSKRHLTRWGSNRNAVLPPSATAHHSFLFLRMPRGGAPHVCFPFTSAFF